MWSFPQVLIGHCFFWFCLRYVKLRPWLDKFATLCGPGARHLRVLLVNPKPWNAPQFVLSCENFFSDISVTKKNFKFIMWSFCAANFWSIEFSKMAWSKLLSSQIILRFIYAFTIDKYSSFNQAKIVKWWCVCDCETSSFLWRNLLSSIDVFIKSDLEPVPF